MMETAIEAKGIVKHFGRIKAIDGVDISVSKGEVFGLIGPDGAGKTTLFRILTSLMLPDAGSAKVCGFDVVSQYHEIRAISGYMPGRFSLYPDLSVEENLQFFAALFGGKVSDNYHLIEPIYAQLEPFSKRRAANLSGGMKQKLALCCALIHKPEVLFLDEPTTGVDAVSRSEFWDILGNIKQLGMPVVVSTPYMDEASRCDRISLINNGRILETGTLDEIISRNLMAIIAVKGVDNYRLLMTLRETEGVMDAFLFGEYIHAFVENDFDACVLSGIKGISEVKKVEAGIEDVFIKIMNDGGR